MNSPAARAKMAAAKERRASKALSKSPRSSTLSPSKVKSPSPEKSEKSSEYSTPQAPPIEENDVPYEYFSPILNGVREMMNMFSSGNNDHHSVRQFVDYDVGNCELGDPHKRSRSNKQHSIHNLISNPHPYMPTNRNPARWLPPASRGGKILCLHGFDQSSVWLRRHMQPLIDHPAMIGQQP